MNFLSRSIWIVLNLFFGAPLAYTLFHWVACDMQMPLIIVDFVSTYLPFLTPLFNVPYVHIQSLSSSIWAKFLFNAFLYAIFGFVHTFFAQEAVQAVLRRHAFSPRTLRTVYCLLSTITAFIIIGFWQHTHVQLWDLLPTAMTVYQRHIILLCCYHLIYLPGWYVVFKFNALEFVGLKQLFDDFGCPYSSSIQSNQRTTGTQSLITSGLFRYCRHPLYLATMVSWTVTPVMSLDRLLILLYTCIYMAIGIRYEEVKLIRIFGEDYVKYQKRVPAVVPFYPMKCKEN